MTLEELREAKHRAKIEIANTLAQFTQATGCKVDRVDIDFLQSLTFGGYKGTNGVYNVHIEVRV